MVRRFQEAGLVVKAPVKLPFHAEELVGNQFITESATIEGHERPLCSLAESMDRSSHQFFPGSRFTVTSTLHSVGAIWRITS